MSKCVRVCVCVCVYKLYMVFTPDVNSTKAQWEENTCCEERLCACVYMCARLDLRTPLGSHWNSPFQSVLWMTAPWSNTTIVYFYISQYFVGFASHRVLFGEDQSYFDLANLWNMPWLGLPLKNIFLSCISVLIDLTFTFVCDKSQKNAPSTSSYLVLCCLLLNPRLIMPSW